MDEGRPQAGEALTVSVETTDTGREASRQARVQTLMLSVLGCGGDAQVPVLTPQNDQQPGIVVQRTPFP